MSDGKTSAKKKADITLCAVCAWRQNCKKQFTIKQSSINKCPDFTRDAALPNNGKQN